MNVKPTVHYEIQNIGEATSISRIIEVALDGLYVLHYDANIVYQIEEYSWLSAKDWVKTLTGLKSLLEMNAQYHSTKILVRNRCFTLIPSDFKNVSQQTDLLKLVINEEIINSQSVSLQSLSANLIWGMQEELNRFLKSVPQIETNHIAQSFIDVCGQRSMQQEEVFITVYHDYFELLAFKNSELQIVNTYDFKTDKDFIYILLTVLQKVDLDRELLQMNIGGKIVADSKLYTQLLTYVKQVRFLDVRLNQVEHNLPLHHYPHLLHTSGLCVL